MLLYSLAYCTSSNQGLAVAYQQGQLKLGRKRLEVRSPVSTGRASRMSCTVMSHPSVRQPSHPASFIDERLRLYRKVRRKAQSPCYRVRIPLLYADGNHVMHFSALGQNDMFSLDDQWRIYYHFCGM